MFLPLNPRHLAWFRLGFLGLSVVAWRSSGRVFDPNAAGILAPWLESFYPDLFLTPMYLGAALVVLAAACMGVASRCLGLVSVALLLPLAFLDEGVQSRQVLLTVLVCLSLLPGVPVWRVFRHPISGVVEQPGPPQWPLLLIRWQLSLVYLANAVAKAANPEYMGGDVLQGLAESHPDFHLHVEAGLAHFLFLVVPAWLAAALPVVFEAAIGLGVWARRPGWKLAVWLGTVAFHLVLMGVRTIFMLNIVCVVLMALVFLWGEPVRAGFRRGSRGM